MAVAQRVSGWGSLAPWELNGCWSGSCRAYKEAKPWAFVLMVSVLIVAALLASYLPALRASRVDPISALRSD